MSDELSKGALDALLQMAAKKMAATPVEEVSGAAAADPAAAGMPMDPAAAGGAPPVDPATGMPMDPAMAGGAMPPVDPATGMPLDPAMMAGAMPGPPPGEDPLVAMLENMAKQISQVRTMVATIADQMGVQMSTNDILEAGDDALDEALSAPAGGAKAAMASDGVAADMPSNAIVAAHQEEQEPSPDHNIAAAMRWAQYGSGR